jgi:Domain of unknown function (DUF4381)
MNPALRFLSAGIGLNLPSSPAPTDDALPPLQPPHAILPPSFWEQHLWAVVSADVLLLALLILLIVWVRRKMPASSIPPAVLARRDLEALRNEKEDGVLLMKASGILRRYVIFACGLPPGELTSAELCQTVAARPLFSPNLGVAIADFFRQCDERKFRADPPESNLGAVATALVFIEKIEQRRQARAYPPPVPSSSNLPPPVPKAAAAPPP